MHLHLASHLGMLDEPRDHVKDMMLEPNPKMVYGGPIPKMEGLSKCRNGRCLPSQCHQTNTDLVLDHRQVPEHCKPPLFLQISLEFFMFDALGYKSLLEPLDA